MALKIIEWVVAICSLLAGFVFVLYWGLVMISFFIEVND